MVGHGVGAVGGVGVGGYTDEGGVPGEDGETLLDTPAVGDVGDVLTADYFGGIG